MAEAPAELEVGQRLRLEIEGLGFGGEGLAVSGGRRLLVPHALPGETVSAEILAMPRGRAIRTRLLRVEAASADRIDPRCPHYDRCPGCQLRHISYDQELEHKRRCVQDAIQRFAGAPGFEVEPVLPAPSRDAYRARARGSVWDGQLVMRPFAADDAPIPLQECAVLSVETRQRAKVWRPEQPVPTEDDAWVSISGSTEPSGWTSPNPAMVPAVEQTVLALLRPHPAMRLIEVGCGNGGLTCAVAPQLGHVVGLDIDRQALQDAERRLKQAGLEARVQLRAGRLEKTWRRLLQAFGGFDTALLNPMRKRLGAKAMAALPELGVRRLVYVGPATIPTARDLSCLTDLGWALERVVPVDLYPGTYHVLTIACASVQGSDAL